VKLTAQTISSIELSPGARERVVFCETFPGFGLRLRPGSRSWIYQTKVAGRTRKMTLGDARVMTPAAARAIAVKMHSQARLGVDPAQSKIDARSRGTVGETLKAYLGHKRAHVRTRHYTEIERYLLREFKALHGLTLAAVDRRAVATCLSRLTTNKGPVSANRARAALGAFYSWAIGQGLCDANPVVGTTQHKETSRARVLADSELAVIWRALGSNDFGNIVRLLILTGCRRNEVGGLRWDEVGSDRITLPPSRVKNACEHIIPLSSAAREVLDNCPRRSGEFVFGRLLTRPFYGWADAKENLDRQILANGAALAHWTLHDLRRSVVTGLVELGVAPNVVESVVNHRGGSRRGVAGIYDRSKLEPQRRAALERWATHVLDVVSGKSRETVIPLHA
jgi:integrase